MEVVTLRWSVVNRQAPDHLPQSHAVVSQMSLMLTLLLPDCLERLLLPLRGGSTISVALFRLLTLAIKDQERNYHSDR